MAEIEATLLEPSAIAAEEGARMLFGGDRPTLPAPFDRGNFLKPTAFVDVQSAMRICQVSVLFDSIVSPTASPASALAIT